MASLFVSMAMGMPMSFPEQISLLVFMAIAAKGAAGAIVGIDKFMSECRALTNFTGNAVATLLIGKWTNEIGLDVARATLSGENPFDELSLKPDAHGTPTNAPRRPCPVVVL